VKIVGSGKNVMRVPVVFVFDFADDSQFVCGFAFGESHVIDLAVSRHFRFEPFQRAFVHFAPDAVQLSRNIL
jgi:hypothetical protein